MYGFADSQDLHKICPVFLKNGNLSDSLSFVLTTADYNYFRGLPMTYAPAIEIVDADAPWPPRWYALHPTDTATDLTTSGLILLNASIQNDRFLFFTVIPTGANMNSLAILICNRNMEVIDTFYRPGKEIDSHDFKLSANGDMMYFAGHDTMIDLRGLSHEEADSAVRLVYETIEIAEAKGKTLFSWNPLMQLGLNAVYLPYRHSPGVMSGNKIFEWSHGNSICYDYDGNILYSFKHIGIGKISRTDGHVIWHIDRNKQKINSQSDALPIFLQHDLQVVKDDQGNISYTILSNGDDEHEQCMAYQFKIDFDAKGTPVLRILKKVAAEKIPNTGGGANFDLKENGDYLFNYGLFKQDTALKERRLFEYKEEKKNLVAEYTILPSIFAYRIHKMTEWRPSRPQIIAQNGQLKTAAKSTAYTWYRLSGPGMKTITKIGEGDKYTPKETGDYCVAAKYGIGWAVSRAFHYTK